MISESPLDFGVTGGSDGAILFPPDLGEARGRRGWLRASVIRLVRVFSIARTYAAGSGRRPSSTFV